MPNLKHMRAHVLQALRCSPAPPLEVTVTLLYPFAIALVLLCCMQVPPRSDLPYLFFGEEAETWHRATYGPGPGPVAGASAANDACVAIGGCEAAMGTGAGSRWRPWSFYHPGVTWCYHLWSRRHRPNFREHEAEDSGAHEHHQQQQRPQPQPSTDHENLDADADARTRVPTPTAGQDSHQDWIHRQRLASVARVKARIGDLQAGAQL